MIRTTARPFSSLGRIAVAAVVLAAAPTVVAQHGPATTGQEAEAPKKVRVVPATPLAAAEPAAQDSKKDPKKDPPKNAERTVLRIGDVAPTPALAEILKGDTDFKAFPEDGVTVMEFWATWCGPCKAGMPHLSELQAKHADQGLTIIGVSREEPKVVKDFLAKKQWDEKTQYTIALDEDSKTNTSYMRAARQNGIPCAFIVDQQGRVAWIGHPMTMDAPLERILAGDWDIEQARVDFEKKEMVDQMMMTVRRSMAKGRRDGDYADATVAIEKALDQMPDDINLRVMKFELLVGPLGDRAGYDIAWDLLKQNRDNARLLNSISWYVLDDESVKDRDLDFAMAAAKAANAAAGGSDPAILDTLARAYFEQGDLGRAIEYQQKAVDRVEGPGAASFVETLEKYKDAASKRPV